MSSDSKMHYVINQRIDAPIRLLGLTLDEAIPVITVVASGFFFDFQLLSLIVAFVYVGGLKRLKKGQSARVLLSWLCWHVAGCLVQCVLRKTPPGCFRLWLK